MLEMLEKKKMLMDEPDFNRTSTLSQMKSPEWESKPHLMNINEDPLLTGQIRHILEEGTNKIGKQSNIKI